MSLSLLQGYSSAEEEEEEEQVQEPEHTHLQYPNSSDDDDGDDEASAVSVRHKSFVELPPPSSGSGLPSALDVFSEVLFGLPFLCFFIFPSLSWKSSRELSLNVLVFRLIFLWFCLFFLWLRKISEPPAFLNNSVEEYGSKKDVDQTQGRHGGRRNRKEKKDLPAGNFVCNVNIALLKLFRFFFFLLFYDLGLNWLLFFHWK